MSIKLRRFNKKSLCLICFFAFIGLSSGRIFYFRESGNNYVYNQSLNNDGFEILLGDRYQYIKEYKSDATYANKDEFDRLLKRLDFFEILITDQDVEKYDWVKQEVTLNKKASKRIHDRYDTTKFPYKERMFIMNIGKKRIFGGIMMSRGSARAVDYPVIYVSAEWSVDETVILYVRPSHEVLVNEYKDWPENSEYKFDIESEVLKMYFQEIGKLD